MRERQHISRMSAYSSWQYDKGLLTLLSVRGILIRTELLHAQRFNAKIPTTS